MKSTVAIALLIVASFVSTGSASAQEHRVQATIPFTFAVGNRTLPAGTYTIGSEANSPTVLQIRSWKNKVNMLTMGQPNQENSSQQNELVFHKYGDRYFLSEIRTQGDAMNVHLPTSKAEKEARTQTEEARLPVEEPVLIALK